MSREMRLNRLRILVADDPGLMRESVCAWLRAEGADVIAVRSVPDAFKVLASQQADILVRASHLPAGQTEAPLPVVAFHSLKHAADDGDGSGAPADAYVSAYATARSLTDVVLSVHNEGERRASEGAGAAEGPNGWRARRRTGGERAHCSRPSHADQAAADSDSRRQHFLAESIPHLVWTTDACGEVNYANGRWQPYAGPTLSLACPAFWSLVHPEERAQAEAAWKVALATGTPFEFEGRLRRTDGSYRWHLARAAPLRDPDGHIEAWFGTATDVDAHKRMEQVTNAALLQAEEAGRLKDEFLALVSHELRTPLTSVLGWAKLLQSGMDGKADPAMVAKGIDVIVRNAEAQARLVEDLLDISSIASGKVALRVRRIDVNEAVRTAAEIVAPVAQERRISLEVAHAPGSLLVQADGDRFEQIVGNLLSNALKFSPPGGRVWLTTEQRGDEAWVLVRDEGRGTAAGFLPHVFERFRQADPTTTRGQGGLGLGLAVVKHLVALHGGTVEAMSEGKDKGATFTVRLPIDAQPPSVAAAADPSPAAPAPGVLEGLRVLVVDDEPDTRELVCKVLEMAGARVRAIGSAGEALRAVGEFRPNALVSDIAMPEMDGYALVRAVRALPPGQGGRVPALALSAHTRASDRREALRAGFQAHLSKPIDPASLLRAVAGVAGRGASA